MQCSVDATLSLPVMFRDTTKTSCAVPCTPAPQPVACISGPNSAMHQWNRTHAWREITSPLCSKAAPPRNTVATEHGPSCDGVQHQCINSVAKPATKLWLSPGLQPGRSLHQAAATTQHKEACQQQPQQQQCTHARRKSCICSWPSGSSTPSHRSYSVGCSVMLSISSSPDAPASVLFSLV